MPDDESPEAPAAAESTRQTSERDGAGPYEAVLFDLGGVIIDLASVRASYVAFLKRFAEREGVDDVDAFVEDWQSALGRYFSSRDGTEFRSARDGYEVALEETLGRDVDRDEWLPLFREASEAHSSATDGGIETVHALADRGLHLGVVSDIDHRDAEQTLDRYGIRDCFDSLVTSESVGRTKPDPAMFEAALDDLPCDPERALYVGDRYEHDMQAGSRAGLTTVAYGGSAAERAGFDADPGAEFGDPGADFADFGADLAATFDIPDDADRPRVYRSNDEHVAFVVDDLRGLLALVK